MDFMTTTTPRHKRLISRQKFREIKRKVSRNSNELNHKKLSEKYYYRNINGIKYYYILAIISEMLVNDENKQLDIVSKAADIGLWYRVCYDPYKIRDRPRSLNEAYSNNYVLWVPYDTLKKEAGGRVETLIARYNHLKVLNMTEVQIFETFMSYWERRLHGGLTSKFNFNISELLVHRLQSLKDKCISSGGSLAFFEAIQKIKAQFISMNKTCIFGLLNG